MASSDNHQRAVPVTGIELALYMGFRLRVYLAIYAGLSPSLTGDNFCKALVSLNIHILGLLAHTIRSARQVLIRYAVVDLVTERMYSTM